MKTFRNLLLEMAAKKTTTKKTKKSKTIVASVVPVQGVQRHYEHAGDVHFNDGEEGAKIMADTFSSIIDSAPVHLATKIDGSPSMEYGIEGGRYYISYKGSVKKSFTHEDIELHHGEKGSQGFKDAMHAMLDHVDKIHNGREGEVHQGDIMWHQGTKPTIEDIGGVPHYTFKPNVLRNAIPVHSEEGQRIQNATFGFAPHTAYVGGVSRNFHHSEEQQHPDVHLFDALSPSIPEEHKQRLHQQVSNLKSLIKLTPKEHFYYISQDHIADWSKRYTSEKRTKRTQNNISFDDFSGFVHGKLQKEIDKLKTVKGRDKREQSRADLLADMKKHQSHIESGLAIHKAITDIGNDIRSVLDSQQTTKRYFDTPAGGRDKTNVEGYVFKPLGILKHAWYKLVDPIFTAKNAAEIRGPKTAPELERTGSSDSAVVSFGRGMGHAGHMALASAVIHHAASTSADPYVVLSKTTGPKDPLTVDEKIGIHRDVFPEHAGVFQPATDKMPSIIEVLQQLHGHGYKNATVVIGEDQKKAFQFIHKYNGQFHPETGKGYKFDNLKIISRQETNDPSYKDFEGPRATDMRNASTSGTLSADEQWQIWRKGMHPMVSDDKVGALMRTVKERLSNKKSIKESIVENMLRNIFGDGITEKLLKEDLLVEDFEQFIKQSHGDKTENITKGSLISDKMRKENIVPTGTDPLEHFRSHISDLSDQHKLWISKAYLNNDTKFEDLVSGINLLKRHTELEKKGIRVASLKSLPSIPELHAHIDNVDPVKVAAPPESAVNPQEYNVHAENEHWKIIEPHTANASKHFGHGSNWCTSADCNNTFDNYRENGPMYIAVPKSPVGKEKERYILQVGDKHQELADYRNNTIEFKHIPKLEQRPFPKDSMFDLTQRVHKDPSSIDQMMNNPVAHQLIARHGTNARRTELLKRPDLNPDAHSEIAIFGTDAHRTELLKRPDLNTDIIHWQIAKFGNNDHRTALLAKPDLNPDAHDAIWSFGNNDHRTALLARPDLNPDVRSMIPQHGNDDHRTTLLARSDLHPNEHSAIAIFGNNDHRTALLSRSDLDLDAHRAIARYGNDDHRTALLARPDLNPDSHFRIAREGTDAHRTALLARPDLHRSNHIMIAEFGNNDHRTALLARPDLSPNAHANIARDGTNAHITELLKKPDLHPDTHAMIIDKGTNAHITELLTRSDLNPDIHAMIWDKVNNDHRTALLTRSDLNPNTHEIIAREGTNDHRTALLAKPDLNPDAHAAIAQYGNDDHVTELLKRPDLNPDAHLQIAYRGNNDHITALLARPDLNPNAHRGIALFGTDAHRTALSTRSDGRVGSTVESETPIKESYKDKIRKFIKMLSEDGEAPPASSGQMTSDGASIAGLGDDARAGNVIVRKRPRIFKRRKQ